MKDTHKIILCLSVLTLVLCAARCSTSPSSNSSPRATATPKSARDNPAIRAVMDYRIPGSDCTITKGLVTFLAIESLVDDIEIDGWYAYPEEEDYRVEFCFVVNGQRRCLEWWHDPQKGIVSPRTVLTQNIQDTMGEFGCFD